MGIICRRPHGSWWLLFVMLVAFASGMQSPSKAAEPPGLLPAEVHLSFSSPSSARRRGAAAEQGRASLEEEEEVAKHGAFFSVHAGHEIASSPMPDSESQSIHRRTSKTAAPIFATAIGGQIEQLSNSSGSSGGEGSMALQKVADGRMEVGAREEIGFVEPASVWLNVIFTLVTLYVLSTRLSVSEQAVQAGRSMIGIGAQTKGATDDSEEEESQPAVEPANVESLGQKRLTTLEQTAWTQLACTVKKSTSKSNAHWHKGFKERYIAVVPMGGASIDGTVESRLQRWRESFLAWWESQDDFNAFCLDGRPAPKGSLSIRGVTRAAMVNEKGKEGFVLLKHSSEDDTHDMHIIFENNALASKWTQTFKTFLGELRRDDPNLTPAAGDAVATSVVPPKTTEEDSPEKPPGEPNPPIEEVSDDLA